jgi:hypothetical protein
MGIFNAKFEVRFNAKAQRREETQRGFFTLKIISKCLI